MLEPIWAPPKERIAEATITAFMRTVEGEWDISVPDYAALYEWSIEKPEQFWKSLWNFVDIIAETPGDTVIENPGDLLDARFFPGARLNFAENLLRHRDDSPAIIFWCEDRYRRTVTGRQLYDLTSRIVQGMRDLGVEEGDRVGAILPNMPETLACMLAANSLGAIWSSCSPDLGARGAIDRLGQIDLKLLFGTDGYYYNGRPHDTLERLQDIQRQLPTLERIVLIPFLDGEPPSSPAGTTVFEDFIAPYRPTEIPFARLPFDQPAFILYTSGTTGVPKCILHGAGRVLLQLFKEHWLHFDVKPGDGFYYFTTAGWNMWYTLATALGPGGTVLMYDGSPFYPKKDTIFDFADATKMAVLGTSPKYLDMIKRAGLSPIDTHALSSLQTILSTGSPLSPEGFDFVYAKIKRNVRLSSISGGTEIMTTFANGNPIGPVWQGELQVRSLGMKVEVYDHDGNPLRQGKGELVCTAPFPSLPLRFWNDPGERRYHETYFSRFSGVWCHNDFVELTEHDGLIILGRSDTVLNPGGIRLGTAEIYRPLEGLEEVLDCLVVGQDWNGDVRVVLFVKLRDGLALDDALVERIKARIREYATPRHVPGKVIQVADIPYTANGKKVELAVGNIIHGREVENTSSLANPEALDLFYDLPELAT